MSNLQYYKIGLSTHTTKDLGKIDTDSLPKHSLFYLIIPLHTLLQHESVYNRENDTKIKVFLFLKREGKERILVMTLWENIVSGSLRMLTVSYESKIRRKVL